MRALDAAFLAMESDDEPRHLGMVMIVESSGDGPLTADVVRERMRERLGRMPSARRRAVDSLGGLGRPQWEDCDPDLAWHVRPDSVAEGRDALAARVAELHARRLDRDRPLWELHVIDGFDDERVALYAKVHLVALDDTTGVDLLTALLDVDDDPSTPIEQAAVLEPDDGDDPVSDPVAAEEGRSGSVVDRLLDPLPDQFRLAAGLPVRLGERAVRSVRDATPGLLRTTSEFARRTPGLGTVARLLPRPSGPDDGREHPNLRAPRLSMNAPVGPGRVVALADLETERIRSVATAVGASFNEVVLTLLAGVLRQWLHERGELPTSPTVAIVPVLVADDSGSGSHVAGLQVALPTHRDAVADRLAQVCGALREATRRPDEMPLSIQMDVAMSTPRPVAAAVSWLMGALPHRSLVSPTVNFGISNVPGPVRQVSLAGRRLVVGSPVLSVSDLTPLHLAVQRGPERTGFGAVACDDHVDDLGPLLGALGDELAELEDLASSR